MTVRRPNLFLIGAMKSGTKYLERLLGAHPLIFMCRPEEPSYFVDPDQLRTLWRWMWEQEYWRSEQRYLELFAGAGDSVWIGEGSTAYTKRPRVTGVARRIAGFAPDARLIYVMRNPLKRTLSHYWWAVSHEGESRSLARALREEAKYRDVSYYAMQLAPYLEAFEREQIAILTSEELFRDPRAVIHRICSWLGVDASFTPADIERPENVTPRHVQQASGRGVLHRIRESPAWARLSPSTPRWLRRFGNALAYRKVDRAAVDLEAALEYLRPRQREQIDELSRVLGRSFSEWEI